MRTALRKVVYFNLLNLLTTYFLLLWTPAILHDARAGPSAAHCRNDSLFCLGVIASPTLMRPRLSTASGSSEFSPSRRRARRMPCILAIGLLDPPFSLLGRASFSAPGSASALRAASMRFPA